MTLSIIIVSYNVKYFLEQCLYSVQRTTKGLTVEVILVDNASSDGSVAYLQERFPTYIFIASDKNLGFSKACNRGLEEASGEYILFLNPDTLLAEDTLHQCLAFWNEHQQAGALGVRMVDGSGTFLRESKRAFPSPQTSFYKLIGLSTLFPHSKRFAKYHLGNLPEHQNHEVDVLAGAFMLIKKEVLDKVGAFDETFFMYGEDIDLSYRIQQAGYKNYYLADTTIIHFKGESTKRGSLNYVRLFYQAMSIFVRKHYGGAKANLFTISLQVAIWARAALTGVTKFIKWIGLPVIDAILILLCFWLVKEIWATYIRTDVTYSNELVGVSFFAFTVLYLTVAYYAGLYNKYYRYLGLIRSTFIATLVLLATYALLPEQLRFSRGILCFGALVAFGVISISRRLLVGANLIQQPPSQNDNPYMLVVGTNKEFHEVQSLLQQYGLDKKIIGRIAIDPVDQEALAHVMALSSIAFPLHASEVIFCAGAYSYKETIAHLPQIDGSIRIRYHAAGSSSIVGSDTSTSSGEALAAASYYKLGQAPERRTKRLIDFLTSLLFILTAPVQLLIVKKPIHFIKNSFEVLIGQKTWISYVGKPINQPKLRQGVLLPNGKPQKQAATMNAESIELINFYYAKDYDPLQDLGLIVKNYRDLGN